MENSSNNEFAEAFRNRTKKFVVDNIKFFRTLPKSEDAKIIGRHCLDRRHKWGQITVLLAEPDQKQSFIQRQEKQCQQNLLKITNSITQ